MGKIVSFKELGTIREAHSGKKIVHCHGVFDLFHFGHLLHLKSAKKFGDVLVVTLTQDKYVNKGPGRPKYGEGQRAILLAALEFVDFVAVNIEPTAEIAIRTLKPHFYVKGPDYRDKALDITGKIFDEERALQEVGGEIVFTADETESSTELLNRYFSQWDEDQQKAIDTIKRVASTQDILSLIESFSKLKVLVVGEPIVDTYVFCRAEGISSKSPTVSAQYQYQEDYAGGSLAIANHLAALGCKTTLLITSGTEKYFDSLLSKTLDPSVKLIRHKFDGVPTPRKTRYMIPFRAQRIFELIHLRSDQWANEDPNDFISDLVEESNKNDLVIVADFGHGIFEGKVLDAMSKIKTFIALNVQANSGNFGFNVYPKHKKFHYLSIDEREGRLAEADRFTPTLDLVRKIFSKVRTASSITLGTSGSIFYDKDGKESICPTFFKEVIDTTGAGDAYFAITSLMVRLNAPSELVPFLGNCYAGLKTRIMGNKSSVSKVDLIRTVQSILK